MNKSNILNAELRPNLLVEDWVIVEFKSAEDMKKVFAKQLLTYLRLMDKRIGILVNFNPDNILTSMKPSGNLITQKRNST